MLIREIIEEKKNTRVFKNEEEYTKYVTEVTLCIWQKTNNQALYF